MLFSWCAPWIFVIDHLNAPFRVPCIDINNANSFSFCVCVCSKRVSIRIACLLIIYEFVVNADSMTSPLLPLNEKPYEYITTNRPSIEWPEDEQLDLMPINSRDYRSNITKDLSEKPWLDDRRERYIIRCVRPTKCEKIQNSTCFGGKIPYKFTSMELTDLGSQENSVKKLNQLEALRNVPKCWAVIQVTWSSFS